MCPVYSLYFYFAYNVAAAVDFSENEYQTVNVKSSKDIAKAYLNVFSRYDYATKTRPQKFRGVLPRIVAVSDTKPASYVAEAYKTGLRHFGEYSIKQLTSKGLNEDIVEQCKDIKWHFLGPLVKQEMTWLAMVPGIFMVETVDSEANANFLNLAVENEKTNQRLKVLVHVNTHSAEDGGANPENAAEIVSHILVNCPFLEFSGFMTFGKQNHSSLNGLLNPAFHVLVKCKEDICRQLHLPQKEIELSMGMNDDFEDAIVSGSTNVHVSSLIFGPANETKPDKPVKRRIFKNQ